MKRDDVKKHNETIEPATNEELSSEELELVMGGFEVKSSDLVTERAVSDIIVCVSGC